GDESGWVLLDEADAQELICAPDWRERAEVVLRHPARVDLEAGDFATPMPRPAKILCCGLNYRDHIIETGREVPQFPTLFAKFADTLTGPTDEIAVHDTERLDWEAELAVVVGAEVHR